MSKKQQRERIELGLWARVWSCEVKIMLEAWESCVNYVKVSSIDRIPTFGFV
jgi:hypothetical protein